MPQVSYQCWIADFTAHLLTVQLDWTPEDNSSQLLSMPAWIPGSYLIRNFARHLADLQAFDQHGALSVLQQTKDQWQIESRGLPITVRYQIYAFDLSVRACYINQQIAILNPAAFALAVQGQTESPHLITLHQPQLSVPGATAQIQHWRVATGLTRAKTTDLLHFGQYQAKDYAQLIDSPILLADFHYQQFEIDGIPHHLVFAGALQADLARIGVDLERVCQQQKALFETLPADLSEYWFLNWIVDQGYGGLEHHNSTLLLCQRYDLPNPERPDELNEEYQNYLALCSHEYFHTWWVKRAKPIQFLNYQLEAEQYTRQLWLYEGFTSYYDDLALVRAGLVSVDAYLMALTKTISRVERAPANQRQSLADSSFTAWTKFYLQDENAVNSVVSYYAKGSLVALCLDAALRERALSLDGLMRLCWQSFGAPALGSAEDTFYQLLNDYCQDVELVRRCQAWVETPVHLPLQAALQSLGVNLEYRAALSAKDLGGPSATNYPVRDFGAWYHEKNDGLVLTAVPIGSAAYDAALTVGDQIIAIGGLRATEQNFNQQLNRAALGTTLTLHYFRQQQLLMTELSVRIAPDTVAQLAIHEVDKVKGWLSSLHSSEQRHEAL